MSDENQENDQEFRHGEEGEHDKYFKGSYDDDNKEINTLDKSKGKKTK